MSWQRQQEETDPGDDSLTPDFELFRVFSSNRLQHEMHNKIFRKRNIIVYLKGRKTEGKRDNLTFLKDAKWILRIIFHLNKFKLTSYFTDGFVHVLLKLAFLSDSFLSKHKWFY